MRILYTVENVAEVFGLTVKLIKLWEKEGLLEATSKRPLRFVKGYIDKFVNDGKLEKHRPKPIGMKKGLWINEL